MKTIPAFIVISAILFFSIATNDAHAKKDPYNVQYEPLDHKLSGTPTFCALEPQKDPILPESTAKLLVKEAKASVDAWVGPLKSTSKRDAKWDINFEIISADKHSTFDFSKCSVLISFLKTSPPARQKHVEVLGQYYREGNVGFIEIYYQGTGTCERREATGPNEITVWTYDCKKETTGLVSVIGATMRHEIGHALGLGHYQSTETGYTYQNIIKPSIMTPIEAKMAGLNAFSNPDNALIMPVDIAKIKEIYGDGGWGNLPQKEAKAKDGAKKTASKPITKTIGIKNGQTIIEKISGAIPMDLYKKGYRADVTISKPDGKTETQKIGVGNTGKFEHLFAVRDDTIPGKYQITVSYFGKEITKASFLVRVK